MSDRELSHALQVVEAEEPEPYDFKQPSKALIAADGFGEGCVLEYTGGAIDFALCEWSHRLSDIGLDDAPGGLSVWEGKMTGSVSYEGEHDAWLEGEFRELTESERRSLLANETIFEAERNEEVK